MLRVREEVPLSSLPSEHTILAASSGTTAIGPRVIDVNSAEWGGFERYNVGQSIADLLPTYFDGVGAPSDNPGIPDFVNALTIISDEAEQDQAATAHTMEAYENC